MKLLRLWFVVLLAVVLPVRGALAATMPCAPGGVEDRLASRIDAALSQSDPANVVHAHALSMDEHAAHDHHEGAAHALDSTTTEKCNVCSASCSSPPLPSAAADIDEPVALASVSYPALSAPAPTFHSDGQERPPRTC